MLTKHHKFRKKFGDPEEYIEGEVHFYGRTFAIDRRVYVPDAETEKLLRFSIEKIPPKSVVVDMGTGSGVLGVSFALERPDCKVVGVDIDREALKVAHKNTKAHNAYIKFYQSCYMDEVPLRKVDFIMADLPYGDKEHMLPSNSYEDLSHMPPIATFHPDGLLSAYKELYESAKKGGFGATILCETGALGPREIKKELVGYPVTVHPLNGYTVTEIKTT